MCVCQLPDRVEASATYMPHIDAVALGCYDFNLYALDRVTGAVMWSVYSGDVVKASAVCDRACLCELTCFAAFHDLIHRAILAACAPCQPPDVLWFV